MYTCILFPMSASLHTYEYAYAYAYGRNEPPPGLAN